MGRHEDTLKGGQRCCHCVTWTKAVGYSHYLLFPPWASLQRNGPSKTNSFLPLHSRCIILQSQEGSSPVHRHPIPSLFCSASEYRYYLPSRSSSPLEERNGHWLLELHGKNPIIDLSAGNSRSMEEGGTWIFMSPQLSVEVGNPAFQWNLLAGYFMLKTHLNLLLYSRTGKLIWEYVKEVGSCAQAHSYRTLDPRHTLLIPAFFPPRF